jgi:PITH domain
MATEMFATAGGGGDDELQNTNMIIDLRDKIDMKDCYGRNVANSYPMSNLFIGDSLLGCCSDTDEQMILHIAFQEFVKRKN